jgi:uncharacterized OsmC-like protein
MLIEYAGKMKLIARHRGLEAMMDQRVEDGGENAAMTPTELFVASIGACAGVYLLYFARRHNIPVDGMQIEVDYTYADRPRRVASVDIRIQMPQPVPPQQHAALLRAAEQCLVHSSLRQPPRVTVSLA